MSLNYISLKDLVIYKLARKLSQIGWKIYEELDWQMRKINGNQFITATDSVGANIAEGYKRYYYLDQVRFYYNSRGSLSEAAEHWLELLYERKKIKEEQYKEYVKVAKDLDVRMNNFIASTYKSKK